MFDSIIPKFTIDGLQNELKNTEFSYSFPEFKSFNNEIYDCEFAELNSEKVLYVKLNMDILDVIQDLFRVTPKGHYVYNLLHSNFVDVTISFDNCGIGSARFDFYINRPIGAPDLIYELIMTCSLADEILFECLKDDLIRNTNIRGEILKKHTTYSIISSNSLKNIPKNLCLSKKELFGISWKYPEYSYADKKMIQTIIGNNIPVQEEDILIVTTQSTLMIFPGAPDDYINERIMAIEMFWIQRHLLKKIDFQLGNIFEDINNDVVCGNLKTAINRIRGTKIRMQSDLDAYRNTILSVTHAISILFETLNLVFNVDKHYNFVQEKMNSCEEIYIGLYSEQQNSTTESIQWIVIFIGSFTFILTLVFDIVYTKNLSVTQGLNALIIVISISLILSYIVKKFLNFLMKRRLKGSIPKKYMR